jgi:hypothetical protein
MLLSLEMVLRKASGKMTACENDRKKYPFMSQGKSDQNILEHWT